MNAKFTRVIFLFMTFVSFSAGATDYYVSKEGNDDNAGTEAEPFLTISKAASIATAGDVVYIMGGVYRETVTPPRSGTEGNPIVFQGVPGEAVIISAMEVVDGFVLDKGSIYKTTIDWDLGQRMFVLSENGPLDLARWPNNTDGDRFTLNAENNTGGSDRNSTQTGYLLSDNIPDLPWENGGSLFFFGASRWFGWKFPVTKTSAGRVDWSSTHPANAQWIVEAHAPGSFSSIPGEFFLEGIKEALDYENEWYFDSSTKALYLQLPGGAKPADGSIQVSKRENVININLKNHIEFRNLAVVGGSILMNGDNNRLYQVSSFYGAMTRGSNLTGLFSNLGAININWKSSTESHKNNIIEKCEIAYSDASGIRARGENTIIRNNYIHDCNYLGTYDAPLLPRGGFGFKITNNIITRGGRDAIQIVARKSEVAYNDISQSNLIADDCGLLYTINDQLDSMLIHHNWFHDAHGRGDLYKATGIYLDNDASDVRVFRNVVWNVEWTNIQMNWDCHNIDVFNNTFIEGSATMGAWHKEGTSFSDVVVWNNLSDNSDWEPQSDKQNNITYTTSPFVSRATLDFSPKEGSEAIDAGREIDKFTDGFVGAAPDVGAYELGDDWVPGVDWDINSGPNNICYGLSGELCNQVIANEIKISPTTVTLLSIGDTVTLKVNILPSNTSNKTVVWSSDNEDIATVDENGVVTAVATGEAKIKATTTIGGLEAEAVIIVGSILSTELSIAKSYIYPNPTTSNSPLILGLGNKNLSVQVTILDTTGRVLQRLSGSDQLIIQTDQLTNTGLYICKLQFKDGSYEVLKFVIE